MRSYKGRRWSESCLAAVRRTARRRAPSINAISFHRRSSMPEQVQIARTLSIREAGYNEYWLQEQIYANPGSLGLGDLEPIDKERRQSSGGRLDLLMKDPEDDTMYEIEVMLGPTDETHIVRTLEYYDTEKRRLPLRQYYPLLVAEQINRRFFNVIHLLSDTVPIIAIQASLVEVGGV